MATKAAGEKKLYMFYIGGNAGRSNIEVHDVQFVAAREPRDAYPALRRAWFGDPDKLHLDGYTVVDWADGFDVWLDAAPAPRDPRLYFVNLGGYREGHLAELHDFGLFVAADAEGAKRKARAALLTDADLQHKDNLKDVDNCLALAEVDGLHVRLAPNAGGRVARPAWQGYRPIGKKP